MSEESFIYFIYDNRGKARSVSREYWERTWLDWWSSFVA